MRLSRALILLGLIVAGSNASSLGGTVDDPKPARVIAPEEPVYLFLNTPGDLDSFWKLIDRPDRVVLAGDDYRKLLKANESTRAADGKSIPVIESLLVKGLVSDDFASMTVEYRVVLTEEGPTWVPIRLDGSTLSEAREGSRDLPARIADDRAWQIELQGKGEHIFRVRLILPIRSTVEGKQLELLIPPVASTGIDIEVPQSVVDASTGVNEKLAIAPTEVAGGTRLQARLSPRSRLELSWRERADPAAKLPPLLEAKGYVAVEIERDSILTRSTWGLSSIRGTVGQISLQLDNAEEVLDVQVDNRSVLVETRREGGRSVVAIPLAEPLRPSTSRSLTLSTRRPLTAQGIVRVGIDGYSFDQANVMSGMIAISRTGVLFLNPRSSRGLRRIDPRTELPDSLRTRADTVLAYEFNGPPFELDLSIELAPPRLQIDQRTTITVDPRSARIQTRLDCQTSQGRVFDLRVNLPKGLQFESAELDDAPASVRIVPKDAGIAAEVGVDVPRILSIALGPQAKEGETFAIVLKGWCSVDPSRVAHVPLFQPEIESPRGGRFAILTERNVSVELAPSSPDEPPAFRVDWGQPPADWVWPNRKPGSEQGLLWLRSESSPEVLPLKATVRPRAIRHETTLTATIDGRGAEVVEEVSGEVAFGTLAKLDLAIPREAADRWDVEGIERPIREPLEIEADGSRRYRLRFAREFLDTFRFRIKYRLPFAKSAAHEPGGRLILAPIRVLEGTSSGRKILIAAEPGVDVVAEARGWTIDKPDANNGATESDPPLRFVLTRQAEDAGTVSVTVRPGPRLSLPSVVVSRLWIKTTQQPDNDLATSAFFWVESHEAAMGIGLASGSRWIRARLGSTELGEGSVELVRPNEYRLIFPPSTPSGPILLAIDYTVPASATSNGWPAPRLLGDGAIQQTVWEAQLLGTRAGIGTPSGWVDENEWYWDGLIFQRRPWKGPVELATWLTGGSTRYRPTELGKLDDRGTRHNYLFSQVGSPSNLRFLVFSRFTLLLLCSGPVLVAGLLVLSRRPPPRLTAVLSLMIAFAVVACVDLNVLILILQSSALGVALFLSALAIHWVLERRNPSRPSGDLGTLVPASSVGSTFDRAPGLGSDDSTAIRVRPITPSAVSTADHIVLSRPLGRPQDEPPLARPDLR